MVDFNPSEITDREILLAQYNRLYDSLEKKTEKFRELAKQAEKEAGRETELILTKVADDIAEEKAAELGDEGAAPIIKKYLHDEALRLAFFYQRQYEQGMSRLLGRIAMWQRNVAMGTMTFGDVWHNFWSNIWTFIFGPWVLGSAFVFLQFLFIGAFITTVTGSSLLLLWLAPVAGGAGVFFLNFQSSKNPMDWLTHFVSGAMIAYSSAIFWVAIFASISNFPGGTTWFWIVTFLSGLFIGTFQLYQLGGFRAVLQVSVLILLFGYIALGPYQAVYRSTIDKVKEPLAFAFTSVKNAVKDVWLLTTNPTEWYARQQIKNVRSESPLEFPKGVEVVSLDPLIPGVGIPAGEEFSVVAVIQNKGRLTARDIYIRAECNQWCNAKDNEYEVSGLKLKTISGQEKIEVLKPGEQDRITVSKLTAIKSDRSALQFAKVTVFINYSYSTNSTLPVKIAKEAEIDRMIAAREDVFRPVVSIATADSPAQLSLNVGPQPLKAGDSGSLLIAVLNARTDGDVVLKANEKFFVDLPPTIGTIAASDSCRSGTRSVVCTVGDDSKKFCNSIDKANCEFNGCTFDDTKEDGKKCTKKHDIMCTILPKETTRTVLGKVLFPIPNSIKLPGTTYTSDVPELKIKGSEFSSILPVFCSFTTQATEVFKSDRIRAELPSYTFVTKKSTEVLITQPLGVIEDAPKISNIKVESKAGDTTKAIVSWTTNKKSTGEIGYGETNQYGKTASAKQIKDAKEDKTGMFHQAELQIETGKTYHYKIDVTDDNDNTANSGDRTFVVGADGKITEGSTLSSTSTSTSTTSSTSSTSTSTSTTTTTAPVASASPVKYAFLTPEFYGGNIGGLEGADQKCQQFADAAGIGASRKWVALLSIPGANAIDRIPDTKYLRLDGEVIANSKADLFDGSIMNPIDRNEKGEWRDIMNGVWTGTRPDGTVSDAHCGSWASADGRGTTGVLITSSAWIANDLLPCGSKLRSLYCFEV
ncbi:MAG: DUF1554 domain-containing protein [Candidatus Aenigmarchaeota archaeon]|nr:DUF1554 domain-containing protein [Candidatus Aenigmarchaeota archaeon]